MTDGKPEESDYIVLGGRRLAVRRHPTDFSVRGSTTFPDAFQVRLRSVSRDVTRVEAATAAERDRLMGEARKSGIAQPVYTVVGTDEEIVLDDRVLLTLDPDDPDEVDRIAREFDLVRETPMGEAHVLRLTRATGSDALALSHELEERAGVKACEPQVLVQQQRHGGAPRPR